MMAFKSWKWLSVVVVTALSACGTVERLESLEEQSVGTLTAAAGSTVTVCSNLCPPNTIITAYTCEIDTSTCPYTRCNNRSVCLYYASAGDHRQCGPGHCSTGYYPAYYFTDTQCQSDPLYPPKYTNSTWCVAIPSSGTLQTCDYSCPTGWTFVSHTSDDRCIDGLGYRQPLTTCTKKP
jgi:hypothetical protein